MDENLHNDKLDEFVNRSFEQYSENPPDSVWDAIEYRMETPVQPKTVGGTNQMWKYAAVIMILLLTGALIIQHYYHNKQLAEIKESIKNNTNNIKQLSDDSNHQESLTKQTPEVNHASNDINALNSKVTADNNNIKPKTSSDRIIKTQGEGNTRKLESFSDKRKKVFGAKDNDNNNNSNNLVEAQTTITINEIKEEVKKEFEPENVIDEKTVVFDETSDIPSLEPVQALKSTIFKEDAISSVVTTLPIPSKRFVPNLYASALVSPTLTYEVKNPQPNFDPMHSGPVNNQQVGAVYSTDLNLRVGANLSTHWGLETGIWYSNMNRVAEHKPQFKFKDHKHGGGSGGPGGPPDSNSFFDFDYGLNTFGGSTNLEVRVENVDSTYMFKDDDQISLNITTKENLEILRVPLVGVYKVPMGRFGLVLKGGFIGNFLLRNELQITDINTNDVKLKDKEDNHHQRPPIESPSKFQLGYLVSTGAYYNLTKNISLTAEPFISGNLSTTNCNGSKLPSYYSIGVNAGLSFNF